MNWFEDEFMSLLPNLESVSCHYVSMNTTDPSKIRELRVYSIDDYLNRTIKTFSGKFIYRDNVFMIEKGLLKGCPNDFYPILFLVYSCVWHDWMIERPVSVGKRISFVYDKERHENF